MSDSDDDKNQPELTLDDWAHVKDVWADRGTDKPVREIIQEACREALDGIELAQRKREVDGDQSWLERHVLEPTIHCVMHRHPNAGFVIACMDPLPHHIGHVRVLCPDEQTGIRMLHTHYANELTLRRVVLDRMQALEHAANATFKVVQA